MVFCVRVSYRCCWRLIVLFLLISAGYCVAFCLCGVERCAFLVVLFCWELFVRVL